MPIAEQTSEECEQNIRTRYFVPGTRITIQKIHPHTSDPYRGLLDSSLKQRYPIELRSGKPSGRAKKITGSIKECFVRGKKLLIRTKKSEYLVYQSFWQHLLEIAGF